MTFYDNLTFETVLLLVLINRGNEASIRYRERI